MRPALSAALACAGATLVTLVLVAAAPPPQVEVQRGDTLEALAERALGDRHAAGELAALNGLAPGARPTPGARLTLPGPERTHALAALAAARSALAQADVGKAHVVEARARLKDAEGHLARAHYREAAQAADAAWRQVNAGRVEPTAFRVEVDDAGTTVRAQSGQPVRVEAQGAARPVYAGQVVRVQQGEPPPPPVAPPAAPRPSRPLDARVLEFPPGPKGLGPVTLAWEPVAGATGYAVEVVPPAGQVLSLSAGRAEVKLQPLPAGRYRWRVWALGREGTRSEASAVREFELVEARLKLEVKGSSWK